MEFLKKLGMVVIVVSKEDHHETEGKHLHAYGEWNRKVDIRSAKHFDLDGFHPNIGKDKSFGKKSAKSSKHDMIKYVTKDGDSAKGFGYYTDTAVFTDIIPECTNISAGGFLEHHLEEWVDLNYTYQVYLAAKEINWERLPVFRKLENRFSDDKSFKTKVKNFMGFNSDKIVKEIDNLMSMIDLSKTRDIKSGVDRHLTYSRWLEDFDLDVWVKSGNIVVDNVKMNLSQFRSYLVQNFIDDLRAEIEYQKEQGKSGKKRIAEILRIFNLPTTFS